MDTETLDDHVDCDRQDTTLSQHDIHESLVTDLDFRWGWE